MAIKLHVCDDTDEMDKPLPPLVVTCGNCKRSWCERCDPAPSAMCHWCNGNGGTEAQIGSKQLRDIAELRRQETERQQRSEKYRRR